MKLKRVLQLYTALLLAFLYAPLAFIVVQSFNAAKYPGAWRGFTLEWYFELARDSEILQAAANGLAVAVLSATLSTVLGGVAAYYFSKRGSSGAADSFFYAPIVIPEIVESVSLLMLYYSAGVELGFWTVLVGHTAYNVSYAYVALKPQFKVTSRSVEDAAYTLGARPFDVFVRVYFPMALPGIVASLLITFAMSFDDFVKTAFTTGPGFKTLPLVIWARAARGRATTELNALASLMILVSLAASYVYSRQVLLAKKERFTGGS
ncbi:ABC transporter permease [Thermofilum pendens]|uniref:Binding-protein-dependent transport systems inner membrane component n=1 Tax=Thermofilum pendens (strain DSM 2475 / Hrk 5) TaxID=368408 RepID=A1RYN2_THEPD|nr:ABC transporter permease [Thermofilum pendens]ABL78312.1 binding-protein-dependent transport systems inner membrane component [Thermofilum pendens Hrk 5]